MCNDDDIVVHLVLQTPNTFVTWNGNKYLEGRLTRCCRSLQAPFVDAVDTRGSFCYQTVPLQAELLLGNKTKTRIPTGSCKRNMNRLKNTAT